MTWPEYYPDNCPPEAAPAISGEVYRFVETNPPGEYDFVPHMQLYPERDWGDRDCQACGLSVYTSIDDCMKAQRVIPSLRKKLTAVANLGSVHGKLMNTPSPKNPNHHTWWHPKEMSDPWAQFEVVAA